MATTAAVNVAQYTEIWNPSSRQGRDVLVVAFSSGLSTTYNSAAIAVQDLREKYPQRKMFTVDYPLRLTGTGPSGLVCRPSAEGGKSIEEVRDWVEAHKLQPLPLGRGGRPGPSSSGADASRPPPPLWAGCCTSSPSSMWTTRGISSMWARSGAGCLPQAHCRRDGEKRVTEPETQTVFISHSDCLEDANNRG